MVSPRITFINTFLFGFRFPHSILILIWLYITRAFCKQFGLSPGLYNDTNLYTINDLGYGPLFNATTPYPANDLGYEEKLVK